MEPQEEIADPGSAQHQVRRLSGAGDAARPRHAERLEALKRPSTRRFRHLAQLRPSKGLGCLDQHVGVAAIAVAEREIASAHGSLAEARRRGANRRLGLFKDSRARPEATR